MARLYALLVWVRDDRHPEYGKTVRLAVREWVKVAVVTALLLWFTNWFDQSTPGYLFEGAVYAWSQTLLADLAGDDPLPVMVVDISNLDSNQRPGRPSPREQLRSLIETIAKEGPPVAIGIDVDFSPDESGWTERGGPQFFDYLSARRTGGLPIYAGADRTRYLKSENWLGDASYKALAVMLAVHADDNRKMPLWIGTGIPAEVCLAQVATLVGETPPEAASGQADCLRSMSAALALDYQKRQNDVYQKHRDHGPRWLKSFAPLFTIDKKIASGFFMVDYGAVQRLRDQTRQAVVSGKQVLLTAKPTSPALLNGIVILGNTQWETTLDKYPIPPLQKEVPGVFFHASGVYTLININGPLREITTWGRNLLDVLAVVICVVLQKLFLRLLQKEPAGESENALRQDRVRWTVTWFVIVIFLAFASCLLLFFIRILWTDWPWVAVTLLLHGWVDRQLERHGRDIGRWLGSEARSGGVT
jgi:CHASE2 domain-containing sensor protein